MVPQCGVNRIFRRYAYFLSKWRSRTLRLSPWGPYGLGFPNCFYLVHFEGDWEWNIVGLVRIGQLAWEEIGKAPSSKPGISQAK